MTQHDIENLENVTVADATDAADIIKAVGAGNVVEPMTEEQSHAEVLREKIREYRTAVDKTFAEEQEKKASNKLRDLAIERLCVHLAKMDGAGRTMGCLRKATFPLVNSKGETTSVFDADQLREYFWLDDFLPIIKQDSDVHPTWQFARVLHRTFAKVTAFRLGYSGSKARIAYQEFAERNRIGVKVEPKPLAITPGVSALSDMIAKYI